MSNLPPVSDSSSMMPLSPSDPVLKQAAKIRDDIRDNLTTLQNNAPNSKAALQASSNLQQRLSNLQDLMADNPRTFSDAHRTLTSKLADHVQTLSEQGKPPTAEQLRAALTLTQRLNF